MYLGKLTCTTGLFFVAIHSVGFAGDGFTVVDARAYKLHVYVVYFFEPILYKIEVKLSLSMQQDLVQCGRLFDMQGRIFLFHGV